uniref:Uncharacterized protein n=1 Tax=Myotis myotis TaxID=51298 RepID=A0A7J7VYX6_MYOMY|nr:hypothetical protein mMyoMyo1_012374 [Myotis myotis]
MNLFQNRANHTLKVRAPTLPSAINFIVPSGKGLNHWFLSFFHREEIQECQRELRQGTLRILCSSHGAKYTSTMTQDAQDSPSGLLLPLYLHLARSHLLEVCGGKRFYVLPWQPILLRDSYSHVGCDGQPESSLSEGMM